LLAKSVHGWLKSGAVPCLFNSGSSGPIVAQAKPRGAMVRRGGKSGAARALPSTLELPPQQPPLDAPHLCSLSMSSAQVEDRKGEDKSVVATVAMATPAYVVDPASSIGLEGPLHPCTRREKKLVAGGLSEVVGTRSELCGKIAS
jgi:hypothetical protein